ncbi:MAG: sugar transferase [Armatimonadota bacterium]
MRIIDLIVSVGSLVLLSPVLLVTALLVKLSSPGPVFYRARRIGRNGTLFTMYKFRTMRQEADTGPRVTAGDVDPRITRIGGWLRKCKLDELPQLINVARGEMTLVGPRPEDPSFLPYYSEDEMRVLSVRPGLTGLVQLIYHELAEQHMHPDEDPTTFYITHVLHQRLALDLSYVTTRSARGDMMLIGRTILHIAGKRTRQAELMVNAE